MSVTTGRWVCSSDIIYFIFFAISNQSCGSVHVPTFIVIGRTCEAVSTDFPGLRVRLFPAFGGRS